MSGPTDPELDLLKTRVPVMRVLGVSKWNGIELGADPNTRPDEEADTKRTEEALRLKDERDKRVRFGASGGPRPRVPT